MKKTVTLLFFVFLYHFAFSQWVQLDSLTDPRQKPVAFSIGDTGYEMAGGDSWYLQTAWAYNPSSNVWKQLQNYPLDNDDHAAGFAIGDTGYVGTGAYAFYEFTNSFYAYIPDQGWLSMANFPGAARASCVTFVINGKGYMGGGDYQSCTGCTTVSYNDFYCFNPDSGKWHRIADCPASGVATEAVAFVINSKAYVGTGDSVYGSSILVPEKDFWEYDPASDTWTRVADFGGGVRGGAVAFATCDKGFVGTGYTDPNQSVYTNDFWQYDPVKNKWTQILNFPGSKRCKSSAFVIGNKGYVGMGWTAPGNYDGALWSYTPLDTASFSADSSICAGQKITFTDKSNYSPTNWYWQFPGGTPDTSTLENPTIEYDSAGTYNVTFSAWNACDSGTQIVTNYITVGQGGALSIKPVSPSVCNGQSVTLKVTDTVGTFAWTPSTGLSDTTGDTVVATPSVTTTYTVTGYDSLGCLAKGIDSVIVIAAPPLNIIPQDTSFCSGQNATLYISGGGSHFIWSPAIAISDSTLTSDSVVADPTMTTTYTVMGTNAGGCAAAGSVVVTVIPSPNKPTFSQDGNVLTSSSKHDNQWYRNDTLLLNDTSQDLTITIPGEYWIVVNNEANGCSTSSDSANIKLAGINRLSVISNQLSIYPNPFTNEIFIKINTSAGDIKDWNLQITDVLGRTVFSKLSLDYSNEIDLSNLSSGVYFITILNKTGRAVFPVVRQN